MPNVIKYLIDENGDKTSVFVPVKTWEKINRDFTKLQKKLKVFVEINEGISEIRDAKNSGQKLQSLKEFLRESNS